MEFVDAAALNCFHKGISLQLSPQPHLSFNPHILLSSDDFPVDEFLDLPIHDDDDDEFVHQTEITHPQDDADDEDISVSVSDSVSGHQLRRDSIVSDLNISEAEVANLEWLSHFVEDSFSAAAVDQPDKTGSVSPPEPCFKSHIPVKARTKRTRTVLRGRVWCLSSPSSTDSSSNSTSSSSSSPEILLSKKKRKRKLASEKARIVAGGQSPRRCSHCGVQKTPQWRTGPLGAKTLCNACGVRFKSGRLLPEYRPACSPSFSTELHSNHHRKVLQMRRGKETAVSADLFTSER